MTEAIVVFKLPTGELLDADGCEWREFDTADEWPDWEGVESCECGAELPEDCSGHCAMCGYYLPDLVARHCAGCGQPIAGSYYCCLDGGDDCCRACVEIKHAAGICPACDKPTPVDDPDGPVWTCPSELNKHNRYWQPFPVDKETLVRWEAEGYFGLCPEDAGESCPYARMPLHSACYDRGNY